MKLNIDSDASYLFLPNAQSRISGYYFFKTNKKYPSFTHPCGIRNFKACCLFSGRMRNRRYLNQKIEYNPPDVLYSSPRISPNHPYPSKPTTLTHWNMHTTIFSSKNQNLGICAITGSETKKIMNI